MKEDEACLQELGQCGAPMRCSEAIFGSIHQGNSDYRREGSTRMGKREKATLSTRALPQ